MEERIFLDKSHLPTEEEFLSALGKTAKYWDEFIKFIQKNIGEVTFDWKHYGKKYGWTLKTFSGKRNLFFTKPFEGYFVLAFVFGAKAEAEVYKSKVSDEIKTKFKKERKYAEGKGVSIEVRTKKDINNAKILVEIKNNN